MQYEAGSRPTLVLQWF